jgi:hypothetical protein
MPAYFGNSGHPGLVSETSVGFKITVFAQILRISGVEFGLAQIWPEFSPKTAKNRL